ncbi:MAG: isoleucine--tRNA ligase [Desulfovibrio sp.]|nr:isoleucine--tRNA ligase [Desulfovibrio sp.]
MNDYKHTLNLPKTSFPMKANLAQREPEMLKYWEKVDAAKAMIAASGEKGAYVLHDGPPYANGHIHMGTAMNKILKDIIVKSRNMEGWACAYIPGWDCHGLPIEHKVEQDLKAKRKDLPALTVRRLCREYASKWIDVQRKEFVRLGVLGDWQNPYLSMRPAYEAAIASNLAEFVAKGGVYRDKKPIYWCRSCHTALAEAEVEYGDETSPSIYVAFPLRDMKLAEKIPGANPAVASIVIWTTTPWTIPDNMAVALRPEFEYVLAQAGERQYLLAKERLDAVRELFGWDNPRIIGSVEGRELEGLTASHPFYKRESPLIMADHVTLDSGTGCVHTAPGHGREDYEAGVKYGLEIYSPMDDSGVFLPSVEFFGGKNVVEANPLVIEKLETVGALLAKDKIRHSYPHCWRCKNPVIFRATTQWFISMKANDLRERSLKAIENDVKWIPAWGKDRIYDMIESRPDWCISRQRQWGVPIVALKCKNCGEAWNDPAWMREICSRFATHPAGCDFWYETPVEELVPPGLKCPKCGGIDWEKETDILDVWFDSGSSSSAVLEARENLSFPADLYLEGSDQHRGWFHSSLLIAEGTRERAPYRSVLTHGYVVDGEGRKMSKSLGNVTAPQELIDKYGAEIIRLWAASVEYREDIRVSPQILERLVDAYRRIRNTCRFILGNFYDFSGKDLVDDLLPLDLFALDNARAVYEKLRTAYLDFDFHKVFHGLHNYCVTDLSALYLDIIKDRLYASPPDSRERRSAQTALWHILRLLLRNMAPIMSFTAEEIFQTMPPGLREPENTVFALQPYGTDQFLLDDGAREEWNYFLTVRGAVNKAIERARVQGTVGHSLDSRVNLYLSGASRKRLENLDTDLRAGFIVSQLLLSPLSDAPENASRDEEDIAVVVEKAKGEKCARCWIYDERIGGDAEYPDLCPRCAETMRILVKSGRA